MKKIKYVHIASGLMLFVIILSISTSVAVAWSNGTHTVGWSVGEVNLNPIDIYYNDYRSPSGDTKRVYYGTHDWIAESALELLYAVRPLNVFLNRLRGDPITNKMLKIYFLFGTEIPDRDTLPALFTTDDQYPFLRREFPPLAHTILYFDDDHFPVEDKLAQEATKLFQQVVDAFQAKDCQRAAAFLGALMHIIGDATMFNHVLPGVPRQVSYESHVDHVTFRTWSDGTRRLPSGNKEFFSVNEARDMLTAFTSISPYLAAILAGGDTRFGGLFFEDANFLLEHTPTGADHGFWDNIDGPIGGNNKRANTWTYQMRPEVGGNSDLSKYFDTIEHNLNMAVFYSAAALSFILDNALITGCSGSDDWPPIEGDDQGRRDRSDVQLKTEEFTGLFFFNMAGIVAVGAALALLSQLKLIEKLPLPYN